MLPPRWVRRVVLAPLAIAVTALVLVLAPVLALIALLLSPFSDGRMRPLRVLALVAIGLVMETLALCALFVLWVWSGFGIRIRRPVFERRHYALVAWYLRVIYRSTTSVLRVRVEVEGPDIDEYRDRPLLVFSRHAGPGDSFLLIHALVNWYEREPRIVLTERLQWHPALDVLLNRLPSRFVSSRPDRRGQTVENHIGALASGLDSDDAFVIFPEGGNFTARRKQTAVARLWAKGLTELAARSEKMLHVLPPRPGGVGAALVAAPDADVVWVAHAGLDDLLSIADVWRALPMDRVLRMRWWRIPHSEVPPDPAEHTRWLYDWWERIDEWIQESRGRD